jgi:hypothetical protein
MSEPHETVHRVYSLPVTPHAPLTDDQRLETISHLFSVCAQRGGGLTKHEAAHGMELAEAMLDERHTERLKGSNHD